MTTTKLYTYDNGNATVTIYANGTKVREYADGVEPEPTHPESIDMKITNWCDGGCEYCHENSVTHGLHAKLDDIMDIVRGLPPGVEIAIGGGDPVSHPDFMEIVTGLKDRGLIPNVTVNGMHLKRNMDKILSARSAGAIYGLGISYHREMFWDDWGDFGDQSVSYLEKVRDENTIIHLIAGEHTPHQAIECLRENKKILVLGYKDYGRGLKYRTPRVDYLLGAWRYWIRSIMGMGVVCFDNLAIKQLRLKDTLPDGVWYERYMGDDGTFTMYADAVTNTFAPSSTSARVPRKGRTAVEYFTGELQSPLRVIA